MKKRKACSPSIAIPSCEPPYWVDIASPCCWYISSSTRTQSDVKSSCWGQARLEQ